MRFVNAEKITPGMKLAAPILTSQGNILVREGSELTKRIIDRIKIQEYNGIYIQDENAQDVDINEVIDANLKIKMAGNLRDVHAGVRKGVYPDQQISELKYGVDEIIDAVINNKNRMVNYIDIKILKDYQFYHAMGTCLYSIIMGFSLQMNRPELFSLGLAGLFHDIGKAFIPESILEKKEPLNTAEQLILNTHAYKGYKYLSESNNFTSQCCVGVLEHHERYDGSGFPKNKVGNDIFLFGRIVGLASVYDSLTSEKAYRKAIPPSIAMKYIERSSGVLFDPDLVQIFSQRIVSHPL